MKRIVQAECACGCDSCYCRASPLRLQVVVVGLENKDCDECTQLNGTFVLDVWPNDRCHFDKELDSPLCVGEEDDKITHMFVDIDEDGAGNTTLHWGLWPCGLVDCPFADATLVGKAKCHDFVNEFLLPAGGGGKCDWNPFTRSVTVTSL